MSVLFGSYAGSLCVLGMVMGFGIVIYGLVEEGSIIVNTSTGIITTIENMIIDMWDKHTHG